MNVVFLDIDGVLIPFPKTNILKSGVMPLEFKEDALTNLILFLKYTDSYIIISSERRRIPKDIQALGEILEKLGFGERIIMITPPNIMCKERAIKSTLKLLGNSHWVIIDDSDIKDIVLSAKAVKVDLHEGFSQNNIYEAIDLLHKVPINKIDLIKIRNEFSFLDPTVKPMLEYVKIR